LKYSPASHPSKPQREFLNRSVIRPLRRTQEKVIMQRKRVNYGVASLGKGRAVAGDRRWRVFQLLQGKADPVIRR
jgi:hypothetical protein